MRTGDSSFRKLFDGGQRVEIPVIQRDYAQGRDDEHSIEVRRRFVEALAETLLVGVHAKPLDLDFVYGRWKVAEQTLEPLDGQQRLTTLFLLHWYVASLDGTFGEFQSWIRQPDGGSCFTYRTRPAAREFFDALVQQPAPVSALVSEARSVSEWVKDSIWFVRSWWRDPTVRGCLTMLDSIHTRFAASPGTWPRLVSMEAPAILFRLLLLENFDLSDDLYVKMNARGKALTRFEVFKAELERFVGETFGNEPCTHQPAISWRDYVSGRLDIAWTDLLWKHRAGTAEIDSPFMHLIRALALVRCVNHDDASMPQQVEQLLATQQPGLPAYSLLGCLDRLFVEESVSLLDTLAGYENAPSFIGRTEYLDERTLFTRVLSARGANQEDGLTLADWVMFYAWCSFLLRFAKDIGTESGRASFHDWIRVIANLVRNSDIDRSERLVAALRGLRKLSSSCGADFLARVADGALDESGGFNQQQQREERLKAQLILRNDDWRHLIETAETHPYFRGGIEFLLRFSGVFDRVLTTGANWSDDDDADLRRSFEDWCERAIAVFPRDAAVWPARFPNFLWERALLATGDYLLPNKRNWSFLDDKDRDASWKRLLRADTRVPDREARRDVVRRVLAKVDPKDVGTSLQAIVAGGVQGDDAAPLSGFRRRLVAEPRLIEYCKLRMLRFEEDTAFLLGRAQRNGYHIDLYVYDLYLRLNPRRAELAPFDDIVCNHVNGTYPPSRVILRSKLRALSLTAEKRSAAIHLQLQASAPNPTLTSLLSGWTADGETALWHSVLPDDAETVVLDLAALIRSLEPGIP